MQQELILSVCSGNLCRSPLIEGFLRWALGCRGLDFNVQSAGFSATTDMGCPPDLVAIAAELAVDLTGHRTRKTSKEASETADLIIAASREHEVAVHDISRSAWDPTSILSELVELLRPIASSCCGVVEGCWSVRDLVPAAQHHGEAIRYGRRARPFAHDLLDPFDRSADDARSVTLHVARLTSQLAAFFEPHVYTCPSASARPRVDNEEQS